ncbi:MAG: response regulator [Oscillospiraceae bacterium]
MSNKQTILIVEDEASISNFMTTILTANNYAVLKAEDAKSAVSMITSYCPDLVLLDLGLPDADGLEVLKQVREWSVVPIVVVSARDREREKVEAFDLGADDYMTKPFGTSELLARIRTALRHARGVAEHGLTPSGKFCVGELSIDFDKREVISSGEKIHLTHIEFKIVELLSKYAGKVLTYDFIIKNIWGPNVNCDNQILRVNMANIRRKIEKNPAEPQYFFTEVGVGYRMLDE